MKAVISVIGKDKVGIIAKTSTECMRYGANIVDISQTVMQEYFTMIMLVEIAGVSVSFSEFANSMEKMGKENDLEIHVMHEDIFNSMHRI